MTAVVNVTLDSASAEEPRVRTRLHGALPHVFGVSWVILAAIVLLLPALIHGVYLGPFDLLAKQGLSHRPGVVPHNSVIGDQITAIIPWTELTWTQVHHGQLPLWNPYNGFGLPLAFNWQSAAFSVPSLLGYLVPLRYAFDVGVFATVLIAGTGAYALGRVIHLGAIGCAMAGTVFELSGPMVGWLGWPHAAVMSWAGWLFAAAILIMRGKSRPRWIASFAVLLACAVYAGQPEIATLLLLALGVFIGVILLCNALRAGSVRTVLRPLSFLAIGVVAGGALSAPLALPGFQLIAGTARSSQSLGVLPAHDLVHLISQSFDGVPIAGNSWFGSIDYVDTAAYVGVIALVLAVVAIARRNDPVVLAFAVMTVAMAALVFFPPVVSLMKSLPFVGRIFWNRALMPTALGIAMSAGVGVDVLVRSSRDRAVRKWTGIGFVVAAATVFLIFIVGRGHIPSMQAAIRTRSLLWPAGQALLGMTVVVILAIFYRRHRGRDREVQTGRLLSLSAGAWAGVLLLTCETAFLLTAGAPLFSSSSQFLTPTPDEVALQRAVGSSTVGFGTGNCYFDGFPLGIEPEVNVAFAVHEIDVYDPIIPVGYYRDWTRNTGEFAGVPFFNEFCPLINTVALARQYGVSFVLEPAASPGPKGAIFDLRVGNEDLYRVPDVGSATLTPLSSTGALPAPDAAGAPVPVYSPNPATWRVVTDSVHSEVLRLRLSNVPGWHATIDGHPLSLEPWAGILLQARVPPGRHVVQLSYWPTTFTMGIVLAACSLIGLSAALVISFRRRAPQGA